jgi:arsenate reductase
MSKGHYNVLFLSNRNTVRSIIAEAVMNRIGRGDFTAFSAGMQVAYRVEPLVLDVLQGEQYSAAGLHPKHWTEFTRPEAPALDFVFTLCDPAAGEQLPHWPGRPVTADWYYPEPRTLSDQAWKRRRELTAILRGLERQLLAFIQLRFEKLDEISLRERLTEIGSATSDAHS